MQWTRSETLALAQQSCSYCYGLGLRQGRSGASTPCNCVFRSIFRACFERFKANLQREKYLSRVTLDSNPGSRGRQAWGMKNEEYIADFGLVSRRVLDDRQYQIFKFHFLLGADWKMCCRRLGMDRGSFFHEIYRIEQKLGKAFRELQPYALFPLDEYFSSGTREAKASEKTEPVLERSKDLPKAKRMVRFPVRSAA